MIVGRHFVFIHFPKTGGTFVKDVLSRHAPEDWELRLLEDHLIFRDIPQNYHALPRIGFIRNPWDWYVSWYFYLKELGTNEFFNRASNCGEKDFKTTLLAIFAMDFIKSSGLGGYSWYLRHTFGPDLQAMHLGRFEDLRRELLRVFRDLALPLPEPLIEAINVHHKSNMSRRDHYRTYYDDELRDFVAAKDEAVIRRFGYSF